jgi:hypothetical protein
MAWPRKRTRKLEIDGVQYLWHFSGHCSDAAITIGRSSDRFHLSLDPLVHDQEIRPGAIVVAIRWALRNGWSSLSGPSRAMAFDTAKQAHVWLPEGSRHLHS